MADAPFRRARRGDPLNGYPSEVYNAVLDLLGSRLDAPSAYRPFTATEPGVLNSSGSALTTRFQILKVADPATTQAQNDSEFAEGRIMSGVTPVAGSAFVVVQEPLSSNVIGRSVLLGITPVKVNMAATSDRYADCTTSLTRLTSAASGPARILWTEDNFAAIGEKWAVVELLGQGAAGPTMPPTSSTATLTITGVTTTLDFTAPSAGTYLITGSFAFHGDTDGTEAYVTLGGVGGGTAYGGPWHGWWTNAALGGGGQTKGSFGSFHYEGAITMVGWFVATAAGQIARATPVASASVVTTIRATMDAVRMA